MKYLKSILYIIVVLGLLAFLAVYMLSEDKPKSIDGDADVVADQMLSTLGKDQWDEVAFLTWNFLGMHTYHWDKKNNNVIVQWGDKEVYLNLDTQKGTVIENGKKIESPKSVSRAWSNWCNDSFWMFAPYKVYDPGTKRELVEVEDAAYGLMVSYESGGVTPGDAYLWLLDDSYMPTGYKMWVNILPIKGVYASWEAWQTLTTGAKVATLHKAPIMDVTLNEVKDGQSWEEIGKSNVDESLFLGQ